MAKTRTNPLYKHGLFSGYTEYRYGAEKKPAKMPRVFKGAKRRHVINEVMDALRDWRTTPFEHESAVRNGLRSGLCLEGKRWPIADSEATLLVQESLTMLGAQRPSYDEGQLHYSLSEEYCHWCYRTMPEENFKGTRTFRYCDVVCAGAARQRRMEEDGWSETISGRSARNIIMRETKPAQICAHCQTEYRTMPGAPATRFCSKNCWIESRRYLRVKPCPVCEKMFTPRYHRQKFCSNKCGVANRTKVQIVNCLHCSKAFRQVNKKVKLCSLRCSVAYNIANLENRECLCCKSSFKPRAMNARFCSVKCAEKMIRERKRAKKSNVIHLFPAREITPALFDQWFKQVA